jgi:hypothetical protein
MFSMSSISDEEIVLNVREPAPLNDMFTMFILSMITASALAVPVIIGVTQATAMWRLFKKN